MKTSIPKLSMAALVATTTCAAHALSVGITPSVGTVVTNPFNGQTTTAWRLVGRSNDCTAVLISPEWVVSTNHCPPGLFHNNYLRHDGDGDAGTLTYLNDNQGTCTPLTGDKFLCKLQNPGMFDEPRTYLPLTWKPTFTRQNASKFGSMLIYGRSPSEKLAFIDWDNAPFGFNPLLDSTASTVSAANSGDSGGTIIWFSPTSGAAAIVGVLSGQLGFFTQDDVTTIVNHITAKGGTVPAVVTPLQHFPGPVANPAPALVAPPTSGGVIGNNFRINWSTPTGGTVDSYSVSVGRNNAIERTASVSAGQGNTAAFSGLAAAKYTACVRPVNANGPSSIAYLDFGIVGSAEYPTRVHTPNCQSFDLRTPGAANLPPLTSVYNAATGTYKVTATWTGPTTPDVSIDKYKVTKTLTYASGIVRTTTQEGSSLSTESLVPAGTQVCVSVTALSNIPLSSAAVQACRTTN